MAVVVTREHHRAQLRALVAEHSDAATGLYGPGSVTWELARESVAFFGGGCAALLQAAHPFVAQAVYDHSQTKSDLPGRFQRTFLNVFDMVFGDLEAAVSSAKRVHNIHARIHGALPETVGRYPAGTTYHANDEGALLWVHATLIHTLVRVTELICGPLSPATKDTYWRESFKFARLFGLSEDALPPDWAAFDAYVNAMWTGDALGVGTTATDICNFLLTPPRRTVAPLWHTYGIVTAGLLPPRLRDAFGFRWGRTERAVYRAAVASARRIYPRIPRGARYVPAYVDARRRLEGKDGRALYGRVLERIVLRGMRRSGASANP